ncbi:MAG: hypothetical protein KF797_05910 [Flavobacteriales bacterium]|nr:hypothetical protein [Flavobacteriales bacterium]
MVALTFGALSIPLAFAVHLVSLALVLGILAVAFGLWGDRRQAGHLLRYTPQSIRRAKLGLRLGAIGTACALVMWVLWATNVLL